MMFRHLILIRLLALLSFLSTSCQKDFSAEVSISGIGPNITKLRVYAWRDRQLAHDRHYDVSENLTDLHIRVPLDEHSKELELVVLGLASETEMRSQGYAKFDVGATSTPDPIQLVETEQLRLATEFSCRNTDETTEEICDIPLIHTAAEDVYWRLRNHLLDRTLDQFSWPVWESLSSKLRNFDSLGANYAVAVSEDGSVLECNGNTCSELQNPAKTSLCGVHIKHKGLAFVVGASGTILKCEGGVCTKQQSSTGNRLCGVIVGDANDLRVVGDKGTILRCDNGQCYSMQKDLTDQNLNAIWGSDPYHFWVVGDGGTVLRCEQSCTKIESTTTRNLAGVWGSDFSSVFVVGDEGTLLVCNESGCTVPPGEKTTSDLKSIHGNQADNVIASGAGNTTLRWNGHDWKKISGNPVQTILTFSVGAWSLTVEPTAEAFALQVPSWATEIQVTVSVTDPAAVIRINGKALASGATSQPIVFERNLAKITVAVQALGTAARVYSIAVTRPPSNYLKASNTGKDDQFGTSVSLSGDTLAIGAPREKSNATGVNGDQTDNSASDSGAVYVFVRTGGIWTQQAYLKASNTEGDDQFGTSVSLSGDTLAVGARSESSNATGVDGDQSDNSAQFSGAAYVFVRAGGIWTQQAYLKASNTDQYDQFGSSVSLAGDTLAVGAPGEKSNATGVNGDQTDNSASNSGAVYVFARRNGIWTQQAYLKASNTEADDEFGTSVSLSGDTLAIGASSESSNATGVDGDQSDNRASNSGAVYVFARRNGIWTQQAYLKASNTDQYDQFGSSVSLAGDTLAVGAYSVGAVDPSVGASIGHGAVYVFIRTGRSWRQQAYLTASNSDSDGEGGEFGSSVSLFGDTLAVGARSESSNATGVDGDQSDNSAQASGAAYVFVRAGGMWTQQVYLKASNTDRGDQFGSNISLSGDTVAISAPRESGNTTGKNGDQSNNDAASSGAVYVF